MRPMCCFQQHERAQVRSSLFLPVVGDAAAHASLGTAALSDALFGASLVSSAGSPPRTPSPVTPSTRCRHGAPSSPLSYVFPGYSVFPDAAIELRLHRATFIFPSAARSCTYERGYGELRTARAVPIDAYLHPRPVGGGTVGQRHKNYAYAM
jgi:hypothetical protein